MDRSATRRRNGLFRNPVAFMAPTSSGSSPLVSDSTNAGLPRVRLELRHGSARPAIYEIVAEQFLLGGAPGCDLRLPGTGLPPVVAMLTRQPTGLSIRKVAPNQPILINGQALTPSGSQVLHHGDCLTIGSSDILISIAWPNVEAKPISAPLVPQVYGDTTVRRPNALRETPPPGMPLPNHSPPSAAPTATLPAGASAVLTPEEVIAFRERVRQFEQQRQQFAQEEEQRRLHWAQRQQELERQEQELRQRQEELETDRVLWYRRRAQWEEEQRAQSSKAGLSETTLARLQEREAALEQREREVIALETQLRQQQAEWQAQQTALAEERDAVQKLRAECDQQTQQVALQRQEIERIRAELSSIRQELFDRYRERREQLSQQQEALKRREAELEARHASLFQSSHRLEDLERREAELEQQQTQLHDEQARLTQWQSTLEQRQRELDQRTQELEQRYTQMRFDAEELELQVRQNDEMAEELRLRAQDLERREAEIQRNAAKINERVAQLESQQTTLAHLRTRLEKIRDELRQEAAQLAAERSRLEAQSREQQQKALEIERLREAMTLDQAALTAEQQRFLERSTTIDAAIAQLHEQQAQLQANEEAFRTRLAELEQREAQLAEQAGILKARAQQLLETQQRLEGDRQALRSRETELNQAEEVRRTLQEQLRRRSEELIVRHRQLEEQGQALRDAQAELETQRQALDRHRQQLQAEIEQQRSEVEERRAELDQRQIALDVREEELNQGFERLRQAHEGIGVDRQAVLAAQAQFDEQRQKLWADLEAQRQQQLSEIQQKTDDLQALRQATLAEIAALKAELPELDQRSRSAIDRLTQAREQVRGHLEELTQFVRQSQDDLAAVRSRVLQEVDRLRETEATLNQLRAEHRLAVSAFRQQLIDWQAQVGEMKQSLAASESRLEQRQAEVEAIAKRTEAVGQELARKEELLNLERQQVAERRSEVERHLEEMRQWYRRKLRELVESQQPQRLSSAAAPPLPASAEASAESDVTTPANVASRIDWDDELDPGDKQLGEWLQSLGLVDADTLDGLWHEARRQRRSLRQVLLSSGFLSLYQLALIETGNLDALVLGPVRVIERIQTSPRETTYRVYDPRRAGDDPSRNDPPYRDASNQDAPHREESPQDQSPRPHERPRFHPPAGSICLLRVLAEAEMHDATHPDEYRQRFAALCSVTHPNLRATYEVLTVQGRPAVLQEWLEGVSGSDWPTQTAHPGVWLRLLTQAASALHALHSAGLTHGRLKASSFLLTTDGIVKLTGAGEPPWLHGSTREGSLQDDLKALGDIAMAWSQAKRRGRSTKAFPETLQRILRRLGAKPSLASPEGEASMTEKETPYLSVEELLADLGEATAEVSLTSEAWSKLLKQISDDTEEDSPSQQRQSA